MLIVIIPVFEVINEGRILTKMGVIDRKNELEIFLALQEHHRTKIDDVRTRLLTFLLILYALLLQFFFVSNYSYKSSKNCC